MVDCQSTLLITITSSVTRLGDFLNFFVTNFLTKVAQIFWQLYGLFKIMLHVNMIWLLFRRYWENWASFYFIIWSHCLREYQKFDHKFMWRPKLDITIIPKNNLAASSKMSKIFVRINFCPKCQNLSKMLKTLFGMKKYQNICPKRGNFVRIVEFFCPKRSFSNYCRNLTFCVLPAAKRKKTNSKPKTKKVFFSFSTFFGRLLFIFFSLHFFMRILTHFIRGSITVHMPLRILHRDRSYT